MNKIIDSMVNIPFKIYLEEVVDVEALPDDTFIMHLKSGAHAIGGPSKYPNKGDKYLWVTEEDGKTSIGIIECMVNANGSVIPYKNNLVNPFESEERVRRAKEELEKLPNRLNVGEYI